MKTFKMMAMALMAVAMCANFASCSNEDVASEEQNEYVTVKLGCGGEILDIKNSPLSRAGEETVLDENDMLLLSIKELEKEGDGEYASYYEKQSYAYAVMGFQNSLDLRLLKGKYYRIYASVIVDGIEKGYVLDNTEYTLGEIIVSSNDALYYDLRGVSNDQYDYDRFYGMLNDFEATENTSVQVDLYRVAYAVALKSNGLSEGESLDIQVTRFADEFYYSNGDYEAKLISDNEMNYSVRTVNYIEEAWSHAIGIYSEDYSDSKYLTITWNKNVADETGAITGTEAINMGTYEVSFKRNAKTTVTIKPENLNVDGAVTITAEAWGEDIGFVIENGQVNEQ